MPLRRIGLDARRKFVEPIAAFFSQVGELHQVIHMWHYKSLDERKQMRQKAWEIDTWSATVAKVCHDPKLWNPVLTVSLGRRSSSRTT